ncbi:MAG: FAD-dependent oxidoreductase [Solirubrobacterales bacterium]|nr:FAD-dependent oxidoreductase [Solirubrobacterales bacterium]
MSVFAAAPHRSYWLEEVLPGEEEFPSLIGDDRADVAIIGGGLVGLWTALRIKERDPACDVVVLEQDVCGGGASGRNGGFVMSWWPKLASLIRLCGRDDALALARVSEAVIGELGSYLEEHAIDAAFHRGGWLWTATSPAQMGAWQPVMRLCDELGVQPFVPLEGDEVARRTGSPRHLAGVLEPSVATVQPAALVRGLRRVASDQGVRIFERTHVRRLTRRRPPLLLTPGGRVRAEKVVIATNAWAANLPELHLALVVISSDIVLTEPIPERLREIGWSGGEAITDSQIMVDYYRTTQDGRIAFGKGGWGIALAGRVPASFDRHLGRARMVAGDLRRYYPALSDVRIVRDWGGPIDRSPDSLPLIGHLGGREHLIYGVGWSGNGVGPSVLAGKILAALALDVDDEFSRLSLVDRPPLRFPPEPVRFLGAHIVRQAIVRKERAENDGRPASWVDDQLAKLAPAGIEDKK